MMISSSPSDRNVLVVIINFIILVIDGPLLVMYMYDTILYLLFNNKITAYHMFFFLLQVVLLVLEALAEISASPAGPPRNSPSQSMSESSSPASSEQPSAPHRQLNKYFHKFMNNVMSLFRTDRKLLEERGSFILRYCDCNAILR